MKAFFNRLMNMNGRRKALVAALCVVTSLAMLVTGVGAWIQYTGKVFGWGSGRVTIEPFRGDPKAKPVAGEATEPEKETEKNPFKAIGENGKFTNENNYPVILRIAAIETESNQKTFYSQNLTEPDMKPCLLGVLPGTGWKTLDPGNILWAAPGEKPEHFGLHYRTTTDGFEFVPYYDREELTWAVPDGHAYGKQEVKCDRITYYSSDPSTVLFATIHDVQYRYFVPGYPDNMDYDTVYDTAYLQWADGLAARAKLADPEKYVTSTPTNAEVFKYWTPEGRDMAMQLDCHCYRFPTLTRTPTKGQWFYNENDGYFYYIGILGKNQSIYPLGLDNQTMDLSDFQGIQIKSYPYDIDNGFWAGNHVEFYAEGIEANKDAAAALWGLTFEPGSLGAMMFAP